MLLREFDIVRPDKTLSRSANAKHMNDVITNDEKSPIGVTAAGCSEILYLLRKSRANWSSGLVRPASTASRPSRTAPIVSRRSRHIASTCSGERWEPPFASCCPTNWWNVSRSFFASTAMMNSLLENKPLDKRNTPVLAESNQLRCQRGSKHCEYGIAPYD